MVCLNCTCTVFRNIQLGPYVLAYRMINIGYGRYRCYIGLDAETYLQLLALETLMCI